MIEKVFLLLPEQNKANLITNLKRNWYFPISAMAFFCMNTTSFGFVIGIPIAFVILAVVASQIQSFWTYANECNIGHRVFSIFTAIGVSWGAQSAFCLRWNESPKTPALEAMLPFQINISYVTIPLALLSVGFIYFCVLAFVKEVAKLVSENKIFQGITKWEVIIYTVLLIISICFVVIVFVQTEVFYGTKQPPFDIIYTSDSPFIVRGNAYLSLTHAENDLRQPLFAVFAAPFLGISYLIGKLFGVSASIQSILMNIPQVVMLFVANFLLAKILKLNPIKRVCFMGLSAFTYMQLLFLLMMEQYIVAYFWLILCFYLINEKSQLDRIALWGTGGTLLTGMVLLPFMSKKSPFKDFWAWFSDMVKYGLEFVGVMLMFCRFDVIYSLGPKISQLSNYTDKNSTISDKFYQYTHFLTNCFAAPDAGVRKSSYVSWQLNPATTVNIVGIGILLLVILSVFLNREKKSSLLAFGWVVFSVVMLFGLGWGTGENGLILYALYFGWAFLVLLFQLVEWIEDKLHTKILVPLISLGTVLGLAFINIPAMIEMVKFAIAYYPA